MAAMLIRYLILAGLVIWPAQAQQVSNPAIAPVPHNTALKAMAGTPQGAIRQGFYAAGDGGYQKYNWSPTNCTAADDGAQVQPTGTGCWIADIDRAIGVNVKIWGAKGDVDSDDGPAFRKACAYAMTGAGNASMTVNIPSGVYTFKTKDSRDNGTLYLGNGADDGKSCSLVGSQAATSLPPTGPAVYGNTALRLGASVNRPVIYIPKQGTSPHIKHLTIDGNKGEQTGWAGGPGGKLYTVQSETVAGALAIPETGPLFDDVVMTSGYNGNLYNGGGRNMRSDTLWSSYAGQGPTDCSIEDWGYDTIHIQPGFGNNTGCGIYIPQGIQYTLYGGATWQNTGAGLKVGGLTSNYINIFGMNFHQNAQGIYNENQPPYATFKAGAVSCNGCTFDGNTVTDIYIKSDSQINKQMKLIAPSFLGHSTGGALPPYNIFIEGGTAGKVDVIAPSLSQTGTPYTTAFTNSPTSVYCLGFECPP